MITKSARDKRNNLRKQCFNLRDSARVTKNWEKIIELRSLEETLYKLYKFYDGIIKAFDKLGVAINNE